MGKSLPERDRHVPEPMRSYGTGWYDLGPRNIARDLQNPDMLVPPVTDNGLQQRMDEDDGSPRMGDFPYGREFRITEQAALPRRRDNGSQQPLVHPPLQLTSSQFRVVHRQARQAGQSRSVCFRPSGQAVSVEGSQLPGHFRSQLIQKKLGNRRDERVPDSHSFNSKSHFPFTDRNSAFAGSFRTHYA